MVNPIRGHTTFPKEATTVAETDPNLITINWHDRDRSRTQHHFGSPDGAEAWLTAVLHNAVTDEEAEAEYGTKDGLAKLCVYEAEGYDEVGTLEVYRGGIGITALDLFTLGHPQ